MQLVFHILFVGALQIRSSHYSSQDHENKS